MGKPRSVLILLVLVGLLVSAAVVPAHRAAQAATPPTLAVTPPTGVAGTKVALTGAGFAPGEPVRITLDTKPLRTAVDTGRRAEVRVDGQGRFSLQVTLPKRLPAGPLTVMVTGAASRATASATYTIPPAALVAQAAREGTGTSLTVTGMNFAAHERVAITIGSKTVASEQTDADGAFKATVAVPAGQFGPITLTAVGQASQIRAQARFTRAVAAAGTESATATAVAVASGTPVPSATQSAVPRATQTVIPSATHTAVPPATHTAVPTARATLVPAALAVNPAKAQVGSTIAVSGSRFQAGEQVDVQLTTAAGTGALHLAYATANSAGNFHLGGVGIPATTPPAAYQILAIGLHSARNARAALQVTSPQATLRVQPTTFAPLATLRVTGANFLPNEPVTIFVSTRAGTAAVLLGQATASGSGAFGPVTLRVPFGVPAGALQVVASGQRSNRQANIPVTVQAQAPTLASSAAGVKPADRVTLTGSHFQPGETVALDVVALSFSTRVGTAQVSDAGTFRVAGVTIPPNTPEGTASLVATGASSHLSAAAQVKVGALPTTLTATRAGLTAGATVNMAAAGFIPGETIIVQLVGGPIRLTLGSAVVGTTGVATFSKITIPAFVPAGGYHLIVSGQTSGRSASTKLGVQAPPPSAPILSILAPASGAPVRLSPGSLVQLAGSHFPGNATVTLALVGTGKSIGLGAVRIAGNGTFGPVGLTVPAATAATAYSLQAQIGGHAVASVAVQVATLNPGLSVAPDTAKPGTTVIIRGGGFAPGEQVVISLNGAALATTPATVLANSSGAFVATAVVPGTLNNGANSLTAIGTSSRASRALTLQGRLPVAARWYLPNGDTTGDHRTVLALLNPGVVAARVTLTFLYQNAPERRTTLRVPAHARASVDLALVAGTGRTISTIVESDRPIGAETTISYGGGDTSATLGAGAPGTRWYLAEGFTGNSFRESLVIMNPNTGFATVDVRFLPFNGKSLREVRFSVGPRTNIRLDVGRYMAGLSVSTIVTADKGVVVERSMRFGQGRRGAHDKVGVSSASTVWLFAQGDASPSRQTFLTILNPNQAAPAAVTATFFGADGRPAGARTIVVDPLRRGNIKVNDVLRDATVSVVVTSNVPVVVERPQYQGPADLNQARSGSDVFGRNGGAISWLFPGGSIGTGGQERLYLFNPGLKAVQLRATLYAATGTSVQRTLTLAPNSRSSLDLNSIGGLPAGPVGARLQSTNGQVFIAERSAMDPARGTASGTQGIAQ